MKTMKYEVTRDGQGHVTKASSLYTAVKAMLTAGSGSNVWHREPKSSPRCVAFTYNNQVFAGLEATTAEREILKAEFS